MTLLLVTIIFLFVKRKVKISISRKTLFWGSIIFLTVLLILKILFLDNIAASEGMSENQHFLAIFKHFLGYPTILAMFSSITVPFGISFVNSAQILNLIFSILIVFLLYKSIVNFSNKKIASIAIILYAFFPSQIFYVAIPSAETTYLFFIMLAVYLFSNFYKNREMGNELSYLIPCIIFCSLAIFIRPQGIIFLIAICLCIFFIKGMKNKITRLTFCICIFLIMNIFISAYTNFVVGQTAASTTNGWSLYVGQNVRAKGRWNKKDAKVFDKYLHKVTKGKKTTSELQDYFFDRSIERINENGAKIFSLIPQKFFYMWYEDEVGYTSLIDMSPDKEKNSFMFNSFRGLSTGYYLSCFVLLIFLVIKFFIKKKKEYNILVFLGSLYILGTIIIHLIFEQAERYTFPCIVFICIIIAILSVESVSDNSTD